MSELVKMLKEDKHKFVKIGAENGSGFFYAGTVDNFLNNIDRVTNACYLAARQAVSRQEAALDKLCLLSPTPETFARHALKTGSIEELTVERYLNTLDRHFGKIRCASEAKENAEDLLDQFQSLELRRVVRSFEADPLADEDCLVVILSGYERGEYWTLEEAKEGNEVGFDQTMPEAV